MKNIIFLLYAVLISLGVHAQYKYKIADIPSSLKEGADMIVRMADMDITIRSKSSVQIKRKYAYTILNAGAEDHAEFVAQYDKLNKIQSVEGTLYDADGNKIKTLKKSEVKDYSATSESNLADDARVKYHSFKHNLYPYTVEYEMETEQDGLFYLPLWLPVFDERVAVESSRLNVLADAGYEVRFKEFNYGKAPVITDIKKQKQYSWSIDNYPAIKEEPFSPSIVELTPSVFLAPSGFEMQKYTGVMNDWKAFGLFMYQLNANRDLLPAAVKQQVKDIAAGYTTTKDKVHALYRFMQKNTRYISIQLGIGGWQTLDANFVGTYGYGDCKALSNYMYAILKEVGIPSHPALIRAGRNEWNILSDFSSTQFNHVILCVPDNKDSIWLECTSQTELPGYLGSFTGNRKALLVTPKGGVLVNTPSYQEMENLQKRNITASIDEQGMLKANIRTSYFAIQQDKLNSILNNASKDQLNEYMRTKFNLSYDIENYQHNRLAGKNPGIDESINLKVNHFASVSGKRLFINPNIASVSSFKLKDAASRKFDLEMDDPFTDFDTVRISIPKGFKPESIPSDVDIRTGNSHYTSTIEVKLDMILYTRYYTQMKARVPATKAKELADFFEKIYKADHSRIVFVKDETGQ